MTGGKPADLMGRGIWSIKMKSTPRRKCFSFKIIISISFICQTSIRPNQDTPTLSPPLRSARPS